MRQSTVKPGLILTLLTVTAQTSAHTETAADQDHSGVSLTSKPGNFFFSNMKAATIAPETNMFPANRNGRRKKKERHLLLGFRCCWSEWVTVFSQGYEAEVILHNGWTSKGVTWKKKSNLTGRLVVKIKKKTFTVSQVLPEMVFKWVILLCLTFCVVIPMFTQAWTKICTSEYIKLWNL